MGGEIGGDSDVNELGTTDGVIPYCTGCRIGRLSEWLTHRGIMKASVRSDGNDQSDLV